ncbi:MAG TPA: tRNA nucleotidyltransferase [Candidatus Enterenecus stercoripullorum]|nr:tRNA nucleotidyltransferase [Candidatus Enterenecus stercoripullorum]
MRKISPLPGPVAECCAALRRAGFSAYPVGGGVRDLLLGRIPQDWDVATSALPDQVLALFPGAAPTGLPHGTVTLPADSGPIEVTTFRREMGYSDGRRPDGVSFGVSLEEDLARRDFTVNAMALAPDGSVIDPFGGLGDLEAGVLRCVGDPVQRFSEDRLRLFRALRFAAQLGFALDASVAEALARAPSTAPLAAERVGAEVEKTLCSPRPAWVGEMLRLGLLIPWLGDARADTAPLAALPAQPLPRWAGLAALVDNGALPEKLRRPGAVSRAVAAGLDLLHAGLPEDERQWRHALARHGPDCCRSAASMAMALGDEEPGHVLESTLAAHPCLTAKNLALSGGDLAALGLSGPDIGKAQARLLEYVLDRPEDNHQEVLRALLDRLFPQDGD